MLIHAYRSTPGMTDKRTLKTDPDSFKINSGFCLLEIELKYGQGTVCYVSSTNWKEKVPSNEYAGIQGPVTSP